MEVPPPPDKRADWRRCRARLQRNVDGAPPPTAYRERLRLKLGMCERDDIKEVYAECKGTGFDVKAVRQLVRMRKQDQAERQEAEAILDLYMAALGME